MALLYALIWKYAHWVNMLRIEIEFHYYAYHINGVSLYAVKEQTHHALGSCLIRHISSWPLFWICFLFSINMSNNYGRGWFLALLMHLFWSFSWRIRSEMYWSLGPLWCFNLCSESYFMFFDFQQMTYPGSNNCFGAFYGSNGQPFSMLTSVRFRFQS